MYVRRDLMHSVGTKDQGIIPRPVQLTGQYDKLITLGVINVVKHGNGDFEGKG
jgi:hypothetical protein